jgi:hypothetical protein
MDMDTRLIWRVSAILAALFLMAGVTNGATAGTTFVDDFETGDLSRWSSSTGLVVQSTDAFSGAYAARASGAAGPATYARKTLAVPQTDMYYRLRFKLIGRGANGVTLVKLRTATDAVLSVSVRSTGTLGYRNDVAATSVNGGVAVDPNVWHEVQVHAHVAGAGGQVDIWYNGVLLESLSNPEDLGSTPIAVLQLGENTAGLTYDVLFDEVAADHAFVGASPTPTRSATRTPTRSPTRTPTRTPTPTPAPVGGEAILVGAGDIAECGSTGQAATTKLLDAVVAANPNATLFAAGDDAYESGTLAEFNNCYGPSWGRYKARTRPVPGNHEYLTADAAGYFDYFNGVGRATGRAGDRGKGYYSFDVGAWHVVAINSNCARVGGCHAGSPQEQWLRADLAAHPVACTLAFWHHPRFSSGLHGNLTTVGPIWQALYDTNADVVVTGHDHVYERFAPQSPTGQVDPARGIRSFVVGTGGNGLTRWGTLKPNSEVRNNDTVGVIKFVLRATSYDWHFLPGEGKTFSDAGSGSCH